MRPIKLTISAFGPYADTQIIDFRKLNNKNLYLITGPTGAGKTTIFDAISGAIYGESSGEYRTSESLRSHCADDKTITSIELDFEVKGIKYNINRIPKQLKKKSRGDGFTEQKSEAILKIYDKDPCTVITGIKDVNEKIESILGINSTQFKQIIMIPQGEFRKLLMANSQERELILQKLFDTNRYREIQEKLKKDAKFISQEINNEKIKQKSEIKRIKYYENEYSILHEEINKEHYNVETIIEATSSLLDKDKKELEFIKNEEIIKDSDLQQKIIYKQKSIDFNQKLNKKQNLLISIQSEKNKEFKIKENSILILKAKKANDIIPLEENFNIRKKEIDSKSQEIKHNDLALNKAKTDFNDISFIYEKEISKENESKRQNALEDLNTLKSYVDKVSNIEKLL